VTISTVMQRLTVETQGHQAEADAVLDQLLVETPTRQTYQAFLRAKFGFVEPLEAELERTSALREVIDLSPRRKRDLLLRDLVGLGLTREQLVAAPRCTLVPEFTEAPTALGWMYTLERSTLAHG